jgi:3-hydroxyisobutyrate dehydrogenase-like beta-hydroxyacid dehydrogenase
MKVAFLGLGNMGSGMARCILRAGNPLTVWNRSPEKSAALEPAGATVATTPADAVKGADVVITSLMDDASEQGLFGDPGGLLGVLRPGAIHLCLTTISPSAADWLTEAHRAHGTRYVSGPVLGRPDAALAGKLVQFVAGDPAAVAEVEPICRCFAATIVPLGTRPSIANCQKLCVNFFVIAMIEAMAESYTLADSLGASRQVMATFFEHSFAHPAFKQYAARLFARDTDGSDGFRMTAGRKDVGLIDSAAQAAGCPLEIVDVIADKMDRAIEQGMSAADWSSIQEISRRRAGLS